MTDTNRPTNRPLPPTEIPDYMYLGFNPTSGQPRLNIYDIIAAQDILGMYAVTGNPSANWIDYENIVGAGVMRVLFIGGKNTSVNTNRFNVRVEIDGVLKQYAVDVPGKGGGSDFQGGISFAGSLPVGAQPTRRNTGFSYGWIPFESSLKISTQVTKFTELTLAMCNTWNRTS